MADVRRLDRGATECGGEEQLFDVHRPQRHFGDRFRRCHVTGLDLVQTGIGVANYQAGGLPGLQNADHIGQAARNPVPDHYTVADITGAQV